jgi:GTPase SAR1 family protein
LFCRYISTAGSDRFNSVATQYYRGAKGALVVYDVARDANMIFKIAKTTASTRKEGVTRSRGNTYYVFGRRQHDDGRYEVLVCRGNEE